MIYRTNRLGIGRYSVTDGLRCVAVQRCIGQGWQARADWDQYLYTDFLATKREAVTNARAMLAEMRLDIRQQKKRLTQGDSRT